MAKLPFLLFRSLRLSHNSTCLCIEKCVRQSEKKPLKLGFYETEGLHPNIFDTIDRANFGDG